jgi:hypothetical protein
MSSSDRVFGPKFGNHPEPDLTLESGVGAFATRALFRICLRDAQGDAGVSVQTPQWQRDG